MAKKVTGETKKPVAKKSTKATASKTTEKKITQSTKSTKSTSKPVDKPVAKKVGSKSLLKSEKSILDISENGVIQQVSEKINSNIRKSEHWHALFFALVVILAAYFSYQAGNPVPISKKDVTTDSSVNQVPKTPESTATSSIVYDFNFPTDYAWLTQQIGDDVNVAPGGSGEFTLQVKNTGKATWYREANTAFRMGTLNPTDEEMPFMASSILADGSARTAIGKNRVEMMQEQVAPGEVATFKLKVTATDWNGVALKPGSYPITVGFMVETKGSLSKQPLVWLMNVR